MWKQLLVFKTNMNHFDNHILKRIKTSLLQIDDEAQVILFGSRARGNSHKESDWDFLFLTSQQVNLKLREKIAKSMLPIELDENIAIQIVPKNKQEWETKYVITPLYKNISKEGITI